MIQEPFGVGQELAPFVDVAPTLIIGLGGTGAEVLSRLRDRFFSTHGPLEHFPVVRYLWLDTDTQQQDNISPWYKNHLEIAQHLHFQTHERVDLRVQNTNTYLDNLAHYPYINRWIYPHLSGKTTISQGAGQIRAYGRLAFFHNIDEVRTKLHNALQDVGSDESIQAARDHKLNAVRNQLNVIIVGSLAGGTGSGIFLDMAYLVRQEAVRLGGIQELHLMGFLALPRVFGGPTTLQRLYANGYAALEELNHYNYSPPALRPRSDGESVRSAEHDFIAQWGDEPAERMPFAPFDVCYLVDGVNEGGSSAGGSPRNDTLFSMIAENIFHDFSISDFGTRKRSERDNLMRFMIEDAHPLLQIADAKLPKRYCSFGLAAIVFPYERVHRACCAWLAGDVIEYWLRRSDDEMEASDFVDKHFLAALGFEEAEAKDIRPAKHDVLDALYAAGEGGRTMQQVMRERVAASVRKVKELGAARDGAPWADVLRDEIDKLDRGWEGEKTTDRKLWGEFVQKMRANQERFLKDQPDHKGLESRLAELVKVLINNEHRGIGFAMAVLATLDERLAQEKYGYLDTWRHEEKLLATRIAATRKAMEGYLDEIADHWQMTPWHGLRGITLKHLLERFEQAAVDLYEARVQRFARIQAISIGEQLRVWISGAREHPKGWQNQLNRLQTELGGLKARLGRRLAAYTERTPDTRQILLYSGEEDLKQIYARYVPDWVARAREYSRVALDALDSGLTELPDRAQDPEGICDRMVQAVSPCFADLAQDYDVFTLFHEKYPLQSEAWTREIQEVLQACQPWVVWERNFIGIQGGMRAEQQRFILGLAMNADDPRYQQFTTAVLNRVPGQAQKLAVNLNSRHQIVFYTEVAGFALCQTSAVATMREEYQKLTASGSKDLHTDKNDGRFSEVVVLNDEEQRALKVAARGYLLGTILGLVRPVQWADTRGNVSINNVYHRKVPGLSPEGIYLGYDHFVVRYLNRQRKVLDSLNEEIALRLSELQSNAEHWACYAAVLRYWIEQHYPPQQVDAGNGAVEKLEPLERRVLREELERIMTGASPLLSAQQEEKFRQIHSVTTENLSGRLVLNLPAGETNSWQVG